MRATPNPSKKRPVAVLAYLGDTLGPRLGGLAWLRRLSPFFYYAGGHPLRNGLQVGDAAVLLGATAAMLGAAVLAFTRRDVAADGLVRPGQASRSRERPMISSSRRALVDVASPSRRR